MLRLSEMNRVAPLWGLGRDIESVLDELVDGVGGRGFPRTGVLPAMNVWEDGECFYAEAEIPGVSMDDVEIYAAGNELTIKGRYRAVEGDDLTYHRRERSAGEFTRMITLPADVNAEKIEAKLKNGVLTVVLPKSEATRMRRITVKRD